VPGQPHRRRTVAARSHPVPRPDAVRESLGSAAALIRRGAALAATLLALTLGAPEARAQEAPPIRLRPAAPEPQASSDPEALSVVTGPRRGFDYDTFEARLESLWFQRKAVVSEGRDADASQQTRQIRAFCAEEGVGRLEPLAGALLVEADRFRHQGDYGRALDALDLAASLDADRAQIHWGRARVLWESGRDRLAAATYAVRALRAGLVASIHDLTVLQPLPLILVVTLALGFCVLALAMVVRYQAPLRHEVEEWLVHSVHERLARAGGLAVLLLPLVVWLGAVWLLVYWLVATFRFMGRAERAVTLVALTTLALLGSAHRFAVSIYAAATDPVVRTTLAAADGGYSPERIVQLRGLVDAHPDNAVYRFLIAGLYKNGRYFEEAFDEYKRALEIDPRMVAAHVNVGNIFFTTGQYGEAIANYHRALDIDSNSLLALFDLHLAQSEAFRFHEAEESLARARAVDPSELARLFGAGRDGSEHATVVDARIEVASVWRAALEGRSGRTQTAPEGEPRTRLAAAFSGPTTFGALLALVLCLLALWPRLRSSGQRCGRCGRAFCAVCKSGRDSSDLCSQCVHLFVLGDGLSPETKRRKMGEIERFTRRSRWVRRIASWLLPGAGHLLRGCAARGVVLASVWLAAWLVFRPALVEPLERILRFDSGLGDALPRAVPLPFAVDAPAVLAVVVLVLTWLAANVRRVPTQDARG
jgi:tetratricopeptide (TPR) repeat protein